MYRSFAHAAATPGSSLGLEPFAHCPPLPPQPVPFHAFYFPVFKVKKKKKKKKKASVIVVCDKSQIKTEIQKCRYILHLVILWFTKDLQKTGKNRN